VVLLLAPFLFFSLLFLKPAVEAGGFGSGSISRLRLEGEEVLCSDAVACC
jgi:hypothetical protein